MVNCRWVEEVTQQLDSLSTSKSARGAVGGTTSSRGKSSAGGGNDPSTSSGEGQDKDLCSEHPEKVNYVNLFRANFEIESEGIEFFLSSREGLQR